MTRDPKPPGVPSAAEVLIREEKELGILRRSLAASKGRDPLLAEAVSRLVVEVVALRIMVACEAVGTDSIAFAATHCESSEGAALLDIIARTLDAGGSDGK